MLRGIISTHADDLFAAGDESQTYVDAIDARLKSFPFGEW